MRQWFLRVFKKNKVSKIILIQEDRRVISFYDIPKNGVVKYKDKSYLLNPKRMYIGDKNIPNYVVNYLSADMLDLLSQKDDVIHTPEAFQVAIDSNVTREVFNAMTKPSLPTWAITALIMVVGLGLLYVTFDTQINELKVLINQLIEAFKSLGGVVNGN